jgi:hypothetical protein
MMGTATPAAAVAAANAAKANAAAAKKDSTLRNPDWYIKDKYDPFEDMALFYDYIFVYCYIRDLAIKDI